MMKFDQVLNPLFRIKKTNKFSCIIYNDKSLPVPVDIFIGLECPYSKQIVVDAINRRPWCNIIEKYSKDNKFGENNKTIIQFSDFENIEWDNVLGGSQKASSYLVRKGLSRKAQLSLQIKRYLSKHPKSILKKATPFTMILETWGAFEEMKLEFGLGTYASFDTSTVLNAPLRQRILWCLEESREDFEEIERADWYWILKPSVTNKGSDINVVKSWESVLDNLSNVPDIREWVLQKYIERPLTVDGYKFHLRVYVLCIGALKVYVFGDILMLLAAHRYELEDLDDVHKHLTNTARSVEDINFSEEKFVKLLEDLPRYLQKERPHLVSNIKQANEKVIKIRKDINEITKELFSAYENEYTTFAPMPNCFELYGLDFMLDENLEVSLLEVNPGPDFKQTGDRLRNVIVSLYEQSISLVVDNTIDNEDENLISKSKDFSLVYDKEWSASNMKGGMKMT